MVVASPGGKILWLIPWTTDLRTARIIRFTSSLTLAIAIVFGIEWPLSFIMPIFTGVFLTLPTPGPTLS